MSVSQSKLSKETERQLIDKAISGDGVALERLLLTYYDRLALHIDSKLPASVRQVVGAEDILQQTFLQVFRDIHNFKPHSDLAFFAWLKTIARNRLLDVVKGLKRKKRGGSRNQVRSPADGQAGSIKDLVEMLSAGGRSPSRSCARHEAIQAVQIGLACLATDQREAIRLRFIEGKSLDEVAAAMGRTKPAVRGLIYRGKEELRISMGRSSLWLSRK